MARKIKNTMSVLFLGDVIGKIGRRGVAKVLPELREEYRPDLVIANAENLAHGKGTTAVTVDEMTKAGVNFFTGGNHTFAKDEAVVLLGKPDMPMIRPANYPPGTPGHGYKVIEVGSRKVLIINLLGRVFMKEGVDDPFRAFDDIFKTYDGAKDDLAAIIVDFHGEVTSEKVAFGWYTDGRASAILGTHTHIPTADTWVLPHGTGYVTDVGMVGGRDTVIGIAKDHVLKRFASPLGGKFEPPDEGRCRFNSVLVEIDPKSHHTVNIERIDREVDIP